jgi:abelson tyrosine-protein kinase 1
VQVAALDERNLKRAVHRYGTLPKGARIGAYLESLRQSGMTPEPVTEQVTISGQFFFSSFSDKYLSRYFG